MINKKYSKYTSEPLSKEDLDALKIVPHQALIRLFNGIGTATDWYNVTYRTLGGFYVSEKELVKQNTEAFWTCWQLLKSIFDREMVKGDDGWVVLESEYHQILSGLEAVDELCTIAHRHSLIYGFRRSRSRSQYMVSRFRKLHGLKSTDVQRVVKNEPESVEQHFTRRLRQNEPRSIGSHKTSASERNISWKSHAGQRHHITIPTLG